MTSFYDIIVTASNSRSTPVLSTNVTVRINVDDENDNPPLFNASSYQGMVSENATVGVVVAEVFAVDPDKVSSESCMRVSLTLMSWSNENKSCMRVDKREFA